MSIIRVEALAKTFKSMLGKQCMPEGVVRQDNCTARSERHNVHQLEQLGSTVTLSPKRQTPRSRDQCQHSQSRSCGLHRKSHTEPLSRLRWSGNHRH